MRRGVPVLLIVLAGCGGSGDDGSTGANGTAGSGGSAGAAGTGDGGDAASIACQTAFDRAVGCGEQTKALESDYLSWCKGWYACSTNAFVPQYAATYWPCANARACGVSDDACADAVAMNRYQNDAAVEQAVDGCRARHDECSADGGATFFGDTCMTFAIVVPELASQMQACLAKPCAEIDACLDQARASFGCTDTSPPVPPPSFGDAG